MATARVYAAPAEQNGAPRHTAGPVGGSGCVLPTRFGLRPNRFADRRLSVAAAVQRRSAVLTVMLAWIALLVVASFPILVAASEPDYDKGALKYTLYLLLHVHTCV